jgi:hypothetical protein
MRILELAVGVLAGCTVMLAATARAETAPLSTRFAVMRGNTQIGTNTIELSHNGGQTSVRIATHVEITIAFVKLYRFDQTETEQWSDGRLQSLSSRTDDNGKIHSVVAHNSQGKLVVDGDGQLHLEDAAILPLSLWSRPIPVHGIGLDPEFGSIVPVSVTDKGEDDMVVAGRSEYAHHFVIKTTFSQDVWYDKRGRLIRVKLQAKDGSTIHYEPIELGG